MLPLTNSMSQREWEHPIQSEKYGFHDEIANDKAMLKMSEWRKK